MTHDFVEIQDLIERVWQEQRFTAIVVTHDVAAAVALADLPAASIEGRILDRLLRTA